MSQLRLFNSKENKRLVIHSTSRDEYFLPPFVQGESPTVDYTLLEQNDSGESTIPWTIITPGSYSLKLGLFTTSGTQLAFQDTFSDDSAAGKKYGVLVYNTSNITTALAASLYIDAYFEAEVTDSSGYIIKPYQRTCRLYKAFITSAAVTVPPEEIGASQSWAKSVFIPKDGSDPNNPCDSFIILSRPSQIPIFCYFDDDGTFHHEPQG